MLITLDRLYLRRELIGTHDSDKMIDDWWTPGFIFRIGSWRVSLATLLAYRGLERNGSLPFRASRLRPVYNESLNAFVRRMLAHSDTSLNAEWRNRSSEDNGRWLQECHVRRRTLLRISSLVGKVGVNAARVMLDNEGPRIADSEVYECYRKIAITVGSHEAALVAMAKVPTHMRAVGMSNFLVLQTTASCLVTNDFSHLSANHNTAWWQACKAVQDFCSGGPRVQPNGTFRPEFDHLQTDISAPPRDDFEAGEGDGLWTGPTPKGRQIEEFVDNCVRMTFAQKEILLSPAERVKQVRGASERGELNPVSRASASWRDYTLHTASYLMENELDLTRPLGTERHHSHSVPGTGNTAKFMDDVRAIMSMTSGGGKTLGYYIRCMGNHATYTWSPLETVSDLRTRLGAGGLSRDEPLHVWGPWGSKEATILKLVLDTQTQHRWDVERVDNKLRTERDKHQPVLARGGQCHPDSPPALSEGEMQLCRGIEMVHATRDAHYT